MLWTTVHSPVDVSVAIQKLQTAVSLVVPGMSSVAAAGTNVGTCSGELLRFRNTRTLRLGIALLMSEDDNSVISL